MIMSIDDITSTFMEKLQHAAKNWNVGEPGPMLGLMHHLQKDAYAEGYQHAIDILQDELGGILERTAEI